MQRAERAVRPAADTTVQPSAGAWQAAPASTPAVANQPLQATSPRDSSPSVAQGRHAQAWTALHARSLGGPRMVAQRRMIGAALSGMQRQVDASSSPALPAYGPDETPAWKDEQGVPQWAKEAYAEEAALTLIASVSEGKIGSVYFPEGRIRTTHAGGPQASAHEGTRTLQFNVDHAAARQAFEAQQPGAWREVQADAARRLGSNKATAEFRTLCRQLYSKRRKRWLADQLVAASLGSLPPWAAAVTSPQTAVDLDVESPAEGTALFEIFVGVSGKVQAWHPSRGVAARFATDKQVVSVLKAALARLDVDHITDPAARNRAFYAFIKSRLPAFVSNIRAPDEV